jgi:hypothetical protein
VQRRPIGRRFLFLLTAEIRCITVQANVTGEKVMANSYSGTKFNDGLMDIPIHFPDLVTSEPVPCVKAKSGDYRFAIWYKAENSKITVVLPLQIHNPTPGLWCCDPLKKGLDWRNLFTLGAVSYKEIRTMISEQCQKLAWAQENALQHKEATEVNDLPLKTAVSFVHHDDSLDIYKKVSPNSWMHVKGNGPIGVNSNISMLSKQCITSWQIEPSALLNMAPLANFFHDVSHLAFLVETMKERNREVWPSKKASPKFSHLGYTLSGELYELAKDRIVNNSYIMAIKMIREKIDPAGHIGLKEAKAIVDAFRDHLKATGQMSCE